MSANDLHEPLDLDGCRFVPIAADDVERLSWAVARSGTMLWAGYAPFLLSYGASPARAVLLGEIGGAGIVLMRRKVRGRDHLDLVVPPLAEKPSAALETLARPLASFNGPDAETRVLWADLPTAAWAARNGWRIRPYEREYLYGRASVLAMNGVGFRHLRKRLHRCEREAMPEVRPYRAADREACLTVLKLWQDQRKESLAPVFDFGYTRAALEFAAAVPERLMTGIVIEVDRRVRAFAFGGMVRPGFGQFFILKSDPTVLGLAETARVALIRRLEGCDLINDAGDLSRPGLRQHKEMFRPTAFVPTWKASR